MLVKIRVKSTLPTLNHLLFFTIWFNIWSKHEIRSKVPQFLLCFIFPLPYPALQGQSLSLLFFNKNFMFTLIVHDDF